MVVDTMKLRILEHLSKELKKHVDEVFDEISSMKTDYCILEVSNHYLKTIGKPLNFFDSKPCDREANDIKRDISFIYYCLTCPFFRELGVKSDFSKVQRKQLSEHIGSDRWGISVYVRSAKHFYRFYADYRTKINAQIQFHL